jgi:hypothetical protein
MKSVYYNFMESHIFTPHYPNALKNSKSNIFPKTLQCKETISHSLEPRPEKREGENMNRMSGCHGTAQY